MMLNNSAHQKPSTRKLSNNLPANRIMIASITNKNKPRVSIVTGIVNKVSKGFTNTLSTAITTLTPMAVQKLFTLMPGNNQAVKYTAKAEINRFAMIDIKIMN